jgi:hypothetical protein
VVPRPLKTVGIVMPADLAVAPYEAIFERVTDNQRGPRHARGEPTSAWEQFAAAWNGLAWRYSTCAAHDEAFTRSIGRHGDPTPAAERYIQERELFGFFVTGLATIESFCYGMYFVGSLLDAGNFRTSKPGHLKAICPKSTACAFSKAFSGDSFADLLSRLTDLDDFREWNDIRNVLAHRCAPPRRLFRDVGATERVPRAPIWLPGITLDQQTTVRKRSWLAATMRELLESAERFTASRL